MDRGIPARSNHSQENTAPAIGSTTHQLCQGATWHKSVPCSSFWCPVKTTSQWSLLSHHQWPRLCPTWHRPVFKFYHEKIWGYFKALPTLNESESQVKSLLHSMYFGVSLCQHRPLVSAKAEMYWSLCPLWCFTLKDQLLPLLWVLMPSALLVSGSNSV